MRNNRNRAPKAFPALLLLLAAVLTAFSALLPASAAGTVRFTEQPKGGTAINYSDFAVTWKTDREVRVMLQTRSSETEDWGNIEWITSPWALNGRDYTAQYRLSAETEDGEVYSDVFTVSWVRPENMTQAVLSVDDFPVLPLGYGECPVLPVTVTNTGTNELTDTFIELTDTSVCDLIQNREPVSLLPGQSDSETWSIRLWPGLGIGEYECGLYLHSPNLAPDDGPFRYVSAEIRESGEKITYILQSDILFFGRLETGYPEQDTIDLTVRNIGTGNLTNVHLYTEDADMSFFRLTRNLWTVETLYAGTDTGSSWYVRLETDLEPGVYETRIMVYADELAEPLPVVLRAEIVRPGEESVFDFDPGPGTAVSSPAESGEPSVSEGEPSAPAGEESASSGTGTGSVPGWVWIVVAASAVLVIAVIVLAVALSKSRKKKA